MSKKSLLATLACPVYIVWYITCVIKLSKCVFTGFIALFIIHWFFDPPLMSAAMLEKADFFTKRRYARYTKLRFIHHYKGQNKGCVLCTGASYTREITVMPDACYFCPMETHSSLCFRFHTYDHGRSGCDHTQKSFSVPSHFQTSCPTFPLPNSHKLVSYRVMQLFKPFQCWGYFRPKHKDAKQNYAKPLKNDLVHGYSP